MPNMLRVLFSYAPRSLRLPELEQKISFLDRHYLVSVHNAENQLQSFFPVERDCKLYKIVATIVTECQLEK